MIALHANGHKAYVCGQVNIRLHDKLILEVLS